MTSEIRANTLKNRVGLGTVSFTNTGPVVSGIVTIANSTSEGVRLEDNAGVGNSLKITTPTGYVSIGAGNATFAHLQTDRGIFYFNRRISVDEGIISSYDEDLVLQSPMNANRMTINKTTGLVSIVNDLDVDGHTNLDNLSVAGVSTFTGSVTAHDYRSGGGVGNTLYLTSADDWRFRTTGGAERLRIHADGEVECKGGGAGQNALLVTGNYSSSNNVDIQTWQRIGGAVQAKMIYKDATTDLHFGSDTAHAFSLMTAGTDRLRINSSGEVSIGTATGGKTLTLYGASSASFRISKSGVLAYDHTFDGSSYTIANNNGSAGIPIIIGTKTSGGESLRITSDGNVAIGGNASPDGKLHVYSSSAGTVTADADADELVLESSGNTGLSILSPGTGESSIYFGNPGTNGQKDAWIKYYHETHSSTADRRSLVFRVSGGEKVRIAGNGDITVTSIDANATGPTLKLFHNSASPAANDVVSRISMFGDDSASNETEYGRIETKIDDPINGQETAHIQFATRGYSSLNQIFRLKNRGTASAPSYTADDINGIILDVYNTGNPYPRYMNFIAKAAGNTDSNIGFWTEAVGGSPTEKLRITSGGQLLHTANKSSGYTARFVQTHADNPAVIEIDSPSNNHLRPSAIQFMAGGVDKWGIGEVYNPDIQNSLHICAGTPSQSNSKVVVTADGHVLFSGLTAKNDPRNAKGITIKSSSAGGGISFQNFGGNGSKNWRIRPDDLSGWGTLEFSVSPTTNSSTDWPDHADDIVMIMKPEKNVVIPNGRLAVGLSGTPSATFEVSDSTGGDYSHTKMGWAQKRTFSAIIVNNETRWYKIVNYQAGNLMVGRLEIYTSRNGGYNQTKGYNEWRVSYNGFNNDIYGTGAENTSFQAGTGNSVDIHLGGSPKNIYIKIPGSVYGGRAYFIFEGTVNNWQFDEGTYLTSAP